MIYLLIHDTLADKTLSFRFKPEIKLVRIIEIFQSKYKHLQGKDLVLSINSHLLDQEWTIRKIMTDYGLTDKGKLELGPRVDSTLQELDDLDFGDLDDLGDISDANLTVTPQKELEIDRTTVPIPSSKTKRKKIEEPELAEPVLFEDSSDFGAYNPVQEEPSVPPPPVLPRRLGKVSNDFDPMADDAFSTVVPTAEDSDNDLAPPVLFSQESEVDLDLDSFSNLTPFNKSNTASSAQEEESPFDDDAFAPIPAKQSDDFLDELSDELFATSDDDEDALSATQTPIPTSVRNVMGNAQPSAMNYDEFDPLADSKVDMEEEKFEKFSEVDQLNPFLQDTSEGFPTLDPDASASHDYSVPMLEEASDPFAPPEQMPEMMPFAEEEALPLTSEEEFSTEQFSSESADSFGAYPEEESPQGNPFASTEESASYEHSSNISEEPVAFNEEEVSTETSEEMNAEQPSEFELSSEVPPLEIVEKGLIEEAVIKQTQPEYTPAAKVPAPLPMGTPSVAPSEAPPLTGVRYKRKILARYFRKMQTFQNFPLRVVLEKEDLKPIEIEQRELSVTKAFQPNAPLIEAVPYFPGCLVVPDRAMLNVQPAHTDFKFWVTPLAAGNLKEARVDFFYRNVHIQSVRMPTKVNRSRTTLFWGLLALLTPLLYPLLNNFGIDLMQNLPRWPTFQDGLTQLGGPVMLGIVLGIVFFCFTLLSYFVQRPKENKPVQQFLDLQL